MSITVSEIQLQLRQLDARMKELEFACQGLLNTVHPRQYRSAVNLLHYLVLRSQETGKLQEALHQNGLSSLMYCEAYIRSQLQAVLKHFGNASDGSDLCHYRSAQNIAAQKRTALFGWNSEPGPYVMVTFKTSFAHDFITVKKLLKAGMQVARINCAHDNQKTWKQMVRTIREASEFTGIGCKIYMDLAGPKIRTSIRGEGRIEVEEEDVFLLSESEIKSDLPQVVCTQPGIISQLRPGERVFFDDGLIETRIIGRQAGAVELEVVHVASKKPFLKAEKGINFPDSQLRLSALTDFDRDCIPFILEHADMIGFSFVHNTPDLEALQDQMKEKKLPVIIKIETPEAFANLPSLFFTAMKEKNFGVMIARGDLAVEMGFEQMPEVQEEILRLCRAAHVPVVYATQVLESMNKKGLPTRSEVTDVSIALMADCIMLNKGPHTARTIRVLKNILQKKTTMGLGQHLMFKPLKMAQVFLHRQSGSFQLH